MPGLEPIPFAQVKALVGKTIYAGVAQGLTSRGREEVWVWGGEPLTLVKAEPFNRKGQPLSYNYVTVKNQDGAQGEVQLVYLSRTPLRYDLRRPGKGEALIRAALEETAHQAVALHRLRAKHRWDPPSEGEEGHAHRTLEAGVEYSQQLVHALVHGSTSGQDQVMRNGRTRWTALAEDERILAWYAGGMDDPALEQRWKPFARCASSLKGLDYFGYEIARTEREKQDKHWLRDLEGLPASKVAALDKKELAERDAEIEKARAKLEQNLVETGAELTELLAQPAG